MSKLLLNILRVRFAELDENNKLPWYIKLDNMSDVRMSWQPFNSGRAFGLCFVVWATCFRSYNAPAVAMARCSASMAAGISFLSQKQDEKAFLLALLYV